MNLTTHSNTNNGNCEAIRLGGDHTLEGPRKRHDRPYIRARYEHFRRNGTKWLVETTGRHDAMPGPEQAADAKLKSW
jgi:hypothetical protein